MIAKSQKLRLCTLALLLVMMVSTKAFSDEISVVTEYLPPFQVKLEDGSLSGFSTEVAQALVKLVGDKASIKVYPWARAYEIASREKNTMIFSIAKTQHRLNKFAWIGELHHNKIYYWGLKSRFPNPPYTIDSLKSYRISASLNSSEHHFLTKHNFKFIYPASNEDRRLTMILKDRTDIIFETELSIRAICEGLSVDPEQFIKLSPIPGDSLFLSIAFNKDSDEALVKKYQTAFIQLKASEDFRRLQTKWKLN